VSTLHEDVLLDQFKLNSVSGKYPTIDIVGSVVDGSVELTIEGASTLSVTVSDPNRRLLKSGMLETEKDRLRAVGTVYRGRFWRLVKVAKSGPNLTLTFEERTVALLRLHKKARKVSRAKATRAQFVLSLVREIKTIPIKTQINELKVKQRIAKNKSAEKGEDDGDKRNKSERRSRGGFPSGVKLAGKETSRLTRAQLRVAATALDTAESMNAGPKVKLSLLIACIQEAPDFKNPSSGHSSSVGVLQLLNIHGSVEYRRNVKKVVRQYLGRGFGTARSGGRGAIAYSKAKPGASAAEITGAVQGNANGASDYTPHLGKARAILKAYSGQGGGGGGSGSGGVRTKAYEFKRNKGESTWDATGRLAEEVGWRRFVRNGVFWFISEEDLYKQPARYSVSEDDASIDWVDFDWDTGKRVQEATVTARLNQFNVQPGFVMELKDEGPAKGDWLVHSVRRGIFDAGGTITLRKPIKEKLEPAPEQVQREREDSGSDSGGRSRRRGKIRKNVGARGIVEDCVRIAQEAGDNYVMRNPRDRGVIVVSDFRPGDSKDHGSNGPTKAARDIAVYGIDALVGPPSPKLDRAVVAIGAALGRDYGNGTRGPFQNADNIQFNGYRVQVIWRTPKWGGHMGHIHVGARKN
jgi:hypothetical protein